jgi:hypothetical protein
MRDTCSRALNLVSSRWAVCSFAKGGNSHREGEHIKSNSGLQSTTGSLDPSRRTDFFHPPIIRKTTRCRTEIVGVVCGLKFSEAGGTHQTHSQTVAEVRKTRAAYTSSSRTIDKWEEGDDYPYTKVIWVN